MQHPIKRFRLGPRLAGLVALSAVLLLTVSSTAGADSSNLLPNGSFQAGTSGWTTTNAALTIANDGADDSSAGRVALNASASSYQLSASPRPVKSTAAGTVYTANGVVRSDTPGKSVCVTLKEVTSGGTLVLTSDGCMVAGSQWAPLPLTSLTAKNDGDLITFLVRRPSGAASGESFEADALSLVAGGGGTGSAPSTPTNVSASAVGSNEIDVSWTASTDPDPGGVAGYAIYRDGGATSIGSVGGSTTSFADTSVGPGETHTYTVSAFDAQGNSSSQSTPSNPATTPQPSGSLVGLWHLDELIGPTAHDSSGHGNNGAISGPIALGLPGKVGTAYSYVPKSAVTIPDASDLRPGTANITISYWVKITTPPCCNGIDYDMFIKGSSTTRKKTGEIKLEVQENGQASCAFYGSLGGKQLQAGPDVIDGQWHQVTCQRIGSQIVENVDGATFSATKATGSITVTDPIKLGSHEGGGDWYNGLLDEVTYSIG